MTTGERGNSKTSVLSSSFFNAARSRAFFRRLFRKGSFASALTSASIFRFVGGDMVGKSKTLLVFGLVRGLALIFVCTTFDLTANFRFSRSRLRALEFFISAFGGKPTFIFFFFLSLEGTGTFETFGFVFNFDETVVFGALVFGFEGTGTFEAFDFNLDGTGTLEAICVNFGGTLGCSLEGMGTFEAFALSSEDFFEDLVCIVVCFFEEIDCFDFTFEGAFGFDFSFNEFADLSLGFAPAFSVLIGFDLALGGERLPVKVGCVGGLAGDLRGIFREIAESFV